MHCLGTRGKTLQSFSSPRRQRLGKYKSKTKKEHQVKRKESEIIKRNGAVHSEEKIDHQQSFYNHVRRQFFGKVFIAFPAIGQIVEVELGRTNKFAALAPMTFEHGDGVVQGETQGDGEKRKENLDIIHKIIETAALYAFIGKPIADEQNNGTQHKETKQRKHHVELRVERLDIHGRNTQKRHEKYT